MLESLQHERDFNRQQSWLTHWERLRDEDAKGTFLGMLKVRWNNGDLDAKEVFLKLINQWISE